MCQKIDNSQHDPVCGDITDIIYEVTMPVIIKKEIGDEDDDDDCEILSFQPPPKDFAMKEVRVKEEKMDSSEKLKPSSDDDAAKTLQEQDAGASAAEPDMTNNPEENPLDMQEQDEDLDVVNTPKKHGKRGNKCSHPAATTRSLCYKSKI